MHISSLAICAPLKVSSSRGSRNSRWVCASTPIMPKAGPYLRTLECSRAVQPRASTVCTTPFVSTRIPQETIYWLLGWAQYALGRYQDAVDALRHESAGGPGVRRILAAALAQLGRLQEARAEARIFLSQFPHFSAQEWGRGQPFQYDADRQHFIDGYVKAGLPD